METILVTGGAGFIGSNLVNYLSKEAEVIVIDNLSMGKLSNLSHSKNIKFFKGDVLDEKLLERIFDNYTFDYIFHLAAIASVADSIVQPRETHLVNQDATILLLEKAKQQKDALKRFVFSSSASVYGINNYISQSEQNPINPLSPYAVDKYSSERYALLYYQLYGLKTTAVRFFNVYGENQNPTSPYSGVISVIVDGLKKIEEGVDFSFNKYGEGNQTRDFIHIKDVVSALVLVSSETEAIGEVYNIGTGMSTSINELLESCQKISGVKIPIKVKEKREGEVEHSLSDITKLNKLGYRLEYSLYEGLSQYIEYEKAKVAFLKTKN